MCEGRKKGSSRQPTCDVDASFFALSFFSLIFSPFVSPSSNDSEWRTNSTNDISLGIRNLHSEIAQKLIGLYENFMFPYSDKRRVSAGCLYSGNTFEIRCTTFLGDCEGASGKRGLNKTKRKRRARGKVRRVLPIEQAEKCFCPATFRSKRKKMANFQ